MGGLNGGAGAQFRSADEAAFAWAMENQQFAKLGQKEHAGTIYSQKGAKGKQTFSYNGSYPGSDRVSDYHYGNIPKGATIAGFIHTHPDINDFSRHREWDDREQKYDEDFMGYFDETDFYLVTPNKSLIVNRGIRYDASGYHQDNERDKKKIDVMASNLNSVPIIHLPVWRDANGNVYRQTPEVLKKYNIKFKK